MDFEVISEFAEKYPAIYDCIVVVLAILPVFGLRVFQDCSDIFQSLRDIPAFTRGDLA